MTISSINVVQTLKHTTASDIFDNCDGGHDDDEGRPDIFGVSVYTNLWHHIYSNPKTSHRRYH